MEHRRRFDRLDVAVLTLSVMVAAIVVALNDREAARFYPWRPERSSYSPRMKAVRTSMQRVESDVKAFLAVSTLGIGLWVLSHPGRIRTRHWPGAGVSAMAVGAIAEILMILWHVQLTRQGHYWLDRRLAYLVVFGTVARVQHRTIGAIVGAWVVLAVSGRWSPKRDLLDRFGRLVSWAWISLVVMETLAPRFWHP